MSNSNIITSIAEHINADPEDIDLDMSLRGDLALSLKFVG